jgi:hypothetical protein
MANSKFCPKCDIRKVIKAPHRDKIVKKGLDGKVEVEYLGYDCRRCGRAWIQEINYNKSGRKVIKWKRA